MYSHRRSQSASKAAPPASYAYAAAAAGFAPAIPGCMGSEAEQHMITQQLQLQAALSRWTGRQGLEVPTAALLRQLQQPPPPLPAAFFQNEEPTKQATPPPPPPPPSAPPASKGKSSSIFAPTKLCADAPTFEPGAGQFKVSHKKRAAAASPSSTSASSSGEGGSPAGGDLPAVISVKKSSRGFAVVLIRDPEVIERGAKQSVAVIDGVCVEVKRHSPKRNDDDDEEEEHGLFIACGAKVASKVTITVEGIEAYFNALASVPCPETLEVRRPFEEGSVSYSLRSAGKLLPLDAQPCIDRPDQEQLLGGGVCRKELVEGLWEQKARLDDLWKLNPPPLARNVVTRVARAQLFPHSGEGGKEHENRAGDKLAELSAACGLLDGVPHGSAFLDLCGGPGAWSQHLLAHEALGLKGFGFTLRTDVGEAEDWQAQDKDQWYPELYRDRRWKALWGADGTGDLLKPGNIEHCAGQLMKEGGCYLCVADGGFSDKAIPPNRLELYFYRLFLGELLMAASCLKKGGRFVCKMYTTFSPATSALLYLTTRLFERSSIVKPMSSRVTGPERYLAAFGFRGLGSSEVQAIRKALFQAHDLCAGASILTTPLLTPVVSPEDLARDRAFAQTAREMAEGLCERQSSALRAVVDRHLELEGMAMEVAKSAGTTERASYDKVEKDRADYEKYQQRKQAQSETCNNDWAPAAEHRRGGGYGGGGAKWGQASSSKDGRRNRNYSDRRGGYGGGDGAQQQHPQQHRRRR